MCVDNIRSPVHPDSYFHNTNCTWVITAPQGQVVEVKFDFLELESHTRCRYDYVAAYDGPLINNTRLRHGPEQRNTALTFNQCFLINQKKFYILQTLPDFSLI